MPRSAASSRMVALSTWRCTATLARLRKSSAGRRVASPNRCLRQHRRRRGQGLGSRGMAMPAGKDAVGGVASGVDLGGQALEHASVNVWRLGPDASERSCRGHGTTFHDQLRKCDSAEEEQLASKINSVLVIRLSATPSATSSLVPNVDTKQPPGRGIVTATGRSSASFPSCARSKDRLRLVVQRSCGSASP
jgi:hypothetical protein